MLGKPRLAWSRGRNWFSAKVFATRKFWSEGGPGGDCFWMLDAILLLGGIRRTRWAKEHYVRYFTNCMFSFQGIVFFLQLYNSTRNEGNDLAETVWEIGKTIAWICAAIRATTVALLQESITDVRGFITSSGVNSGDSSYDQLELRKFNRTIRTTLRFILSWFLVTTLFFNVPNSISETALGLPRQFRTMGPIVSFLLHCCAVNLFMGLQPRYGTSITTSVTLMTGMRYKLHLIAHRYNRILVSSKELSFDNLNRMVNIAVAQQLEYWRHLTLLKDIVQTIFIFVHYFSIVLIGAFIYISKYSGVSFFSVAASLLAPAFLMFEYCYLCRLADDISHEAESICDAAYELCSKIPYSRENHSKYIQLRSMLVITWVNTHYGISMRCFNLFEISTPAFVDLINTTYSLVAFLANMD